MTYKPMTLDQGHDALRHVIQQIGWTEVVEGLINHLCAKVEPESLTEMEADALKTLEALMVRHCGERV